MFEVLKPENVQNRAYIYLFITQKVLLMTINVSLASLL